MLASHALVREVSDAADVEPTIARPPFENTSPRVAGSSRLISDCRTVADLKSWLLTFVRGFGFYGGRYIHLGHTLWGSDRFDSALGEPRRSGQAGQEAGSHRPMRFISTSGTEDIDGQIEHWLVSDPAVAQIRAAFAPFSWSTRAGSGSSAAQRAWLDRERARGVGAGIAVPIQDYIAGPAYLSLFGIDEAAAVRLIEERAPELAFVGAQFHALAKLLVPTTDGLAAIANLTNREIECLTLAAMGRTVVESGRALRISGRTVEFHLRNAGEKLGAATKLRAVALAVGSGLIHV